MNVREELENAIANLYIVFSEYPLRPHIEACPCCVSKNEDLLIHSKLLKNLTAFALERFVFNAITTWGTVEDFKHFLPRIFELFALKPDKFLWSNLVIEKLDYADWYNWAQIEKTAVTEFIVALWNYILSGFPAPGFSLAINNFLTSLGKIFKDLKLFLDLWRRKNSISAQLHLAQFILDDVRFNEQKIRVLGLLKIQSEQIINWLLEPVTIESLEKVFFENLEESFADRLAKAIDIVFVLQNK
jgi:hypothetical protein